MDPDSGLVARVVALVTEERYGRAVGTGQTTGPQSGL